MILEQTAELPAVSQVFQKGLAPVLNHHVNGKDPRVNEVAEDEVHDSVLPAKRHSGHRAILCKGQYAIASATPYNKSYYLASHIKPFPKSSPLRHKADVGYTCGTTGQNQ